jgi:uncharacterized membrane protein
MTNVFISVGVWIFMGLLLWVCVRPAALKTGRAEGSQL